MGPEKNPFLDRIVDGLYFSSRFSERNYYTLKNLSLRDGDVILSTYPKCGTNWVACIVWLILHPDQEVVSASQIMRDIPFVDKDGLAVYADNRDTGARTLLTHLPADRIPENSLAKYINIVRNPFDCVVSYFRFMQDIKFTNLPDDGESVDNNFFEWFLSGHIGYNDFFDHVLSWYNRRHEKNVLFMTYEELKKDHKGGVLRIARFLGREETVKADGEKLLDKIVHQSSFSFMKNNLVYNDEAGDPSVIYPLVRKGQVGGFRNSLTPDQVQRLREKMEKTLAATELFKIWGKL